MEGLTELTAEMQRLIEELRVQNLNFQAALDNEVATGVLHNVGNVLDSVNVSTNLLAEHVRKSKGGGLARVAAVLREHAGNLGDLLASVETKFGELPRVKCNVSELNQVFLNLIVNAAHAIQESGKDAATGVIAVRTSAAGGTVEVAISDNGCGIGPQHADKVFDPFYVSPSWARCWEDRLSYGYRAPPRKRKVPR